MSEIIKPQLGFQLAIYVVMVSFFHIFGSHPLCCMVLLLDKTIYHGRANWIFLFLQLLICGIEFIMHFNGRLGAERQINLFPSKNDSDFPGIDGFQGKTCTLMQFQRSLFVMECSAFAELYSPSFQYCILFPRKAKHKGCHFLGKNSWCLFGSLGVKMDVSVINNLSHNFFFLILLFIQKDMRRAIK